MKKNVTKKSLIAASLILALTACGDDGKDLDQQPAWFAGDQVGNLFNDVDSPLSGTLMVHDINPGEDRFNVKTGEATAYGTFSITENGAWVYTLDISNADVAGLSGNAVLTDTIVLTSIDGTQTSIVITIKSTESNVAAEFSGDLTLTIDNTTSDAVTGQVNVTDPDDGEEGVDIQTGSQTTYGAFSIDEDALWTYTLDITNSSVAALVDENDFLTDTIEITSIDGTATDVIITITGESDDTGLPPAVEIPEAVDEFSFTDGSFENTGSASDVVAAAKTSGNPIISNTTDASGEEDGAVELTQGPTSDNYGYITYSSTDNSGLSQITGSYSTEVVIKPSTYAEYSSDVALIDFANTSSYEGFKTYMHKTDRNVHFKVYDGSSTSTSVSSDNALVDDTWYHIVSVYDADASEFGTITLYINGVEVDTKDLEWIPADPLATDKAVFVGGSSSDNKNLNGAVDHIATYNEILTEAQISARATEFFTAGGTDPGDGPDPIAVTDDFESYTVGELISKESDDWGTNNIKDNSDGLGTTTAEVSNGQAKSGTQSLFLQDLHTNSKPFAHRQFSTASGSGEVSFDVYIPSGNAKASYFMIGTGKDNSDRYFELKINGTNLQYEAGDSDPTIASDVALDAWHSISIAWTEAGEITITFDDVALETINQADTGLTSSNTPSQFTLYVGDNSSDASEMYIDNVDSTLFK